MTAWKDRPREERTLLNPAFCAQLIWHAAGGCTKEGERPLAFEEAFVVLPMVLHRGIREALPHNLRTSLPVWLSRNASSRGEIASSARFLAPFTREALLFGGTRGLLEIRRRALSANHLAGRAVRLTLKDSSDEVRECAKRAEWVGRWFALAGNPATVLALLGVRP